MFNMPDHRVHCDTPQAEDLRFSLSPPESHHLVTVNRARVGDPVIAFDGHGGEWDCSLEVPSKSTAVLKILGARRCLTLPHALTLAQALPKGPCMDAIVRKATELGARCIIPMVTERTQVHLDSGRKERKEGKWQVAALEAAKQCGNPWLPEIRPLSSLEEVLSLVPTQDLCLVASLHPGARGLKQTIASRAIELHRMPLSVLWLVGPEGDFSPVEMERILKAGVRPVTLGPLVLRCETAAVAALAILAHELTPESCKDRRTS